MNRLWIIFLPCTGNIWDIGENLLIIYENNSINLFNRLIFSCFVCSKMFWNFKALFFHFKNHHSSIKIFMCLICGKNHKCGYDLKCHKEVHFPKAKDNEMKFHCNLCSKSYGKKHLLTRHMDFHNDVKSFFCEICGKGFITKATLQNHKMCHRWNLLIAKMGGECWLWNFIFSDLRPFECNICNETFKNKYKLKFHKTIHTDERNFQCNVIIDYYWLFKVMKTN